MKSNLNCFSKAVVANLLEAYSHPKNKLFSTSSGEPTYLLQRGLMTLKI